MRSLKAILGTIFYVGYWTVGLIAASRAAQITLAIVTGGAAVYFAKGG